MENSFLIIGQFHAPLSLRIQKDYNKLIMVIAQVPTDQHLTKQIAGTAGNISVRDILAYQIGWATLLVSWYQGGLANQRIIMPGLGFTTWDYTGLAKLFYKKYQLKTISEQLKTFHRLVKQIIAIVEQEYSEQQLDALGIWAWCTLASGKQWPLSKWIIVNTSSPYRKARGLIVAMLKLSSFSTHR